MKALVVAMGERGTPRHPSQQRDPFRFGSGNHAREGRIDELGDEQRPALYGGRLGPSSNDRKRHLSSDHAGELQLISGERAMNIGVEHERADYPAVARERK
jgi:hypothetical protein